MGWQEQGDGNYVWSDDGEDQRREEQRDREREEERDREREEEREREREREKEREEARRRAEEEARRRAEEEERQRQIEEQRRQVEEEQRRMAEEEARRQAEEAQRQQEEAEAQAALSRNQEAVDQGRSEGQATDEPSAMDQWLRDREAEEQAKRDAEREYTPNVEGDRYRYGQDPMAVAEPPAPPEIIEPLATPDPVDLDQPKEEDVVAEATRAAEEVYRSGGSATQAQAAAGAAAAKSVSIDRQSLGTQTPWTQQAFRTQYGQSADTEWVRQHEAELRRNQQTYGSPEPTPGTRPIASAPANTPVAPDRRIGQTPPPAAPSAPAQNVLGLGAIGDVKAPGGTPAPVGLERDTDMLTIRDATPGGTDAAQIRRSDWNQWPTEIQSRWTVTNAVGEPPTSAAPAPGAARPSTALPGIQPLQPRTPPEGIRTGPPTAGEPGGPPLATPPPPVPPNPNTPNLYPTPPETAVRGTPAPPNPNTPNLYPTPPETASVPPQQSAVPAQPPPPNLRDPVYARSYNGTEGWFNREEVGRTHTTLYDPKQTQPRTSLVDPNTPVTRPHPASQQVQIDAQGNVIDPLPTLNSPLTVRMSNIEMTTPPTAAGAEDMSARVIQALDSPTPLTSITELAGLVQGKNLEESRGDYTHVINGVGALLRGEEEGVWAEPYLNDVARLAWARERLRDSGERVDPRLAPTDYIENWKDALLGNDPNVPLVREVNQQLIDAAVDRQPRGGKFDWRTVYGPTGENGLVSKQTTGVDCGPNAFSNVLRANGYNADPAQAFTFSRKTGYHNGREFTGPDNFARMLRDEAGLDARNQTLDWKVVDQELAEGRIVTLSGPSHYWTIASKKDGKYYVGQTGTVAGNPAWSDPKQLFYAGSGPSHMITYKGEVNPNARGVRELGLKPPVGSGNGVPNRALLSTSTSAQRNAAGPAARLQSQMTARMSTNTDSPTGESVVSESIETLRRDAQNEDPWSKDPAGQANRHKGMRLYHEMPIQERERIFDESMDTALTAEGINDPTEREYWKDNAKKVVKGAGFPGENPMMNPFAMAGENKGTPLYAAPASDKSPASNELNSSAMGYYQFIVHDPRDRNKDPYGHRQFVPEGGNIYDPVTQHRMFIRSVRGGKHKGDPASVFREKRDSRNHTWGP